MGQPELAREAAVTAGGISQWLARERETIRCPPAPGRSSLEVRFLLRNTTPACIGEFKVVNYLLISQKGAFERVWL